jgi:hypothetical protein
VASTRLHPRKPDIALAWNTFVRLSVPTWFVFCMATRAIYILNHPASSSDDARLYFQATQAWVNGGDPWAVRSSAGFLFAAPPPCLLLNLPLLPFGETVAAVFWPIAGLASVVLAIRHYKLPWWWIMWPPFTGGIWPGSPDVALLGLTLLGAGAISGATKVYSLPGMLGEGRWRAALGAAVFVAVTFPLLPWSRFISEFGAISSTLAAQSPSGIQLPLIAIPPMLLLLLSLRRAGLLVATPALWPHPQDHYFIWSIEAARRSRVLAIAFSVPVFAPFGVAVVAVRLLVQRVIERRGSGQPNESGGRRTAEGVGGDERIRTAQ